MWIGLEKKIKFSELEQMVQRFFYPKKIGLFQEFPEDEWPEVFGNIVENDSEFPLILNFYNLEGDENHQQKICIELSKSLSELIGCRAICDGSGFGEDDSPYWCIIWDSGVSYLADDCGTTFGDGEVDKPVVIVREIGIQT